MEAIGFVTFLVVFLVAIGIIVKTTNQGLTSLQLFLERHLEAQTALLEKIEIETRRIRTRLPRKE